MLAALEVNGEVRATAGYRITDFLARGRNLYVDDLVTAESSRSSGYGKALLQWLIERARAERCVSFELDSGVQRHGAHRFYLREGMHISAYHFALALAPRDPARP